MEAPERLRPEETARVVRSNVEVELRLLLKFVVNADQVVVALRAVFQALSKPVPESAPLTRSVSLKVEEAFTKIPAVVDVGVKVGWPAKAIWKAPLKPAPSSLPQERTPVELVSMVLQETRLSKVRAPVAVSAPVSLVLPTTPKVVVGTAVPMPTLEVEEIASTNKAGVSREAVVEATRKYPTAVVVPLSPVPVLTMNMLSEAFWTLRFEFTLKVSLNVEEALMNRPAVVEVGVKVLCPAKAMTRFCSVALPVWLARAR